MARDKFGGNAGTQLTNLANAAAAAPRTNQEAAARLAGDQDKELRQIARGPRVTKQIAPQLNHPNLPRVARVNEEQQGGLASRAPGKGENDKFRAKEAKGKSGERPIRLEPGRQEGIFPRS